ncbi:MAG: IPTL-CTERM sorting domain-containing protein [Saprospiraceae bacterium]|nr:IPTL-CTERM sorting domain-containing protein [Saprospiraceae bacterium]
MLQGFTPLNYYTLITKTVNPKQSSFRRFLLGIVFIFSVVLSSQAAVFTVTSTADSGPNTLRQAILDAQGGAFFLTRDTIVFNLPPASTITLLSPLNIDNCCAPGYTVIIGPGADDLTIDGNGMVNLFTIKNGDLYNMTLTNGFSNSVPAAVNVVGGGSTILSGLRVNNMTGSMGAVHMNSFNATLDIYNCIISGNQGANNGCGIKHNTNGTVNIINSTIAFNEALFNSGGINNNSGGPMTIRNSIVAMNTAQFGNVDVQDLSNAITFGTNLIGDVAGTNLVADGVLLGSTGMEVDPLFVMDALAPPTATGDFHLQPISPALNMGVNGDIPPAPFDMTDLEGNTRIAETTVDLGAYESLPPPMVTVAKTDTELIGNMDGVADQGETFRYTVTISNAAMVQDALMTVFTSGVDLNTSLVVGSVTTTQGTVTTGNTGGDTSVGVDVGTVASGGSVTITFDVTIDIQSPATEISCQGSVTGDNFTALNTDDPDTPTPDDATITMITPPDVSFTKTAMHIDGNGNNIVDHGEIVRYTLMVSNAANVSTALGVMVDSGVDPNAELVVGSVTTDQGSVTTGNTAGDTDVSVDVGDINAGSTVTIMFDFEVTFGAQGGTIVCQATASGTNFMDVLSDDPAEPGDADPTITAIPTMGEWGIICLSLLMLIGGIQAFRTKEKLAF